MNICSARRVFPALIETSAYSCFARHLFASAVRECNSIKEKTDNPAEDVSRRSQQQFSENDAVNPDFINRNPRNLEHMGIARKTKGWNFQYPPKDYYHRLVFTSSKQHTVAAVEHCSGKEVLSASTKEMAISHFLYSNKDVVAARNIGRVIAQRCLQSGLTNMVLFEPEASETSEKFQAFKNAVIEGGVELSEPEEVVPDYEPGIDYDDEYELADLRERQARATRGGPITAEKRKTLTIRKKLAASRIKEYL